MKFHLDALWDDTPVNVNDEVNAIWDIANILRGAFQRDEYKDVILPMTIIRRFDCALAAMKDEVVKYKTKHPKATETQILNTFDIRYFNTSPFTLSSLLDDSENIQTNFFDPPVGKDYNPDAYIQGFSSNVYEILEKLEIEAMVKKLAKAGRLYNVIRRFSEIDLDPRKHDQVKMGYIFEELIRRFSENKSGGENYTGRDITKLMVSLLLSDESCADIFTGSKAIPILDQACGTGGMISTGFNYIKHVNADADVYLFGQEISPKSYAICKAEMLIKGHDADNIRETDTMKEDCFPGQKMRFVIENPPFGQPWGGDKAPDGCEKAVKEEFKKGFKGRWGAGLPDKGDMQLLFIQSAIHKLAANGRAAIIEDGSPLFAGSSANSGASRIRKWLIEEDLLETIVALPEDLFYNTNIGTYIWILTAKGGKSPERRGKVQFIDATKFCKPLGPNKSLGKKRNLITPEFRDRITRIYTDFKDVPKVSRIFDKEEFLYREYTVIPPMQRNYAITDERIETLLSGSALNALYSPSKREALELKGVGALSEKERKEYRKLLDNEPVYNDLVRRLRDNADEGARWPHPEKFIEELKGVLDGLELDRKLYEAIAHGLSVPDRKAEYQYDKKGKLIYDESLKDTEIVPFKEDIEAYMARAGWPGFYKAGCAKLGGGEAEKKTGAEFPFTRYFYEYKPPRDADEVLKEVFAFDKAVEAGFAALRGAVA